MVTTVNSFDVAPVKRSKRREAVCRQDRVVGNGLPGHDKKSRRRHIDPTTCERDYDPDELDFMRAMDEYKRRSGRMFPTCSEILEVIRSLGYVRLGAEERERRDTDVDQSASEFSVSEQPSFRSDLND
jgi:hypothetical protein